MISKKKTKQDQKKGNTIVIKEETKGVSKEKAFRKTKSK